MKIILCVVGIALQICFIVVEAQKKYLPAVILKGSASLMFVLLGLVTSKVSVNTSFANKIVIGLVLGGIGDVLLNLRYVFPKKGQVIFLTGVASFLAGHILYLASLVTIANNLIVWLIIGVVLAAALLYWIFTTLKGLKVAYKIFGILYIGSISIMTAVALGNCLSNANTANIIYLSGAVLFLISDIVMIFNTFGSDFKQSLRTTNLSLYYLGQLAIALSLLYF